MSKSKKSPNASYIVFCDSKLVIFYTNDLTITPSKDLLEVTNKEAISCVQGVGPLHRWTGNKTAGRSVFYVPAMIVGYKMYMNSADILDQRRSTNPAQKNEKCLNMSIFTMVLDLAIYNANLLHCWLHHEVPRDELNVNSIPYKEFK